ncbi:theronine dehydrogenase [Opitutaceae bacterium TAV4]|uniref:zinc-dependent alcohol dehydrogenase n=1 Tax=Geminisphaera colitermitum TaxID=1148786 RepID=UPI0005B7F176|nr:zinc-binding dehydrogenase [Geminisphaera colitermitum]RRJ95363.1 theronine dehydrogenase [Opitutaceae bacterium TAV4]RRK02474.1 theronine dehydrogenase [Opitutaceae bacterium TAV3]
MKTTSSTGRRLVFPQGSEVILENFTPATPAADEVLVEVERSLLSTGTETIVYARNFAPGTHWDNWVKYPFYPGYTAVGIVRETGNAVTALKPGDRVACRAGHASHAVLKAENCFPVPDGVTAEQAAWFALAKITGHGVRAARIGLGDTVAVIGAGPIGQMTCRWALVSGASRVICVDLAESRLKLAAAAGAIPIVAPADQALAHIEKLPGVARPRVVIESTGNAAVLKSAFSLVETEGTVVLIGDTGTPGSQTLTSDVITRGLTLVGAHDGRNSPVWNNRVAADCFFAFVRSGRFSLAGLNTHHFTPAQCKDAYTLAINDRTRTMGVLFDWSA